jgi:hypothetical protein
VRSGFWRYQRTGCIAYQAYCCWLSLRLDMRTKYLGWRWYCLGCIMIPHLFRMRNTTLFWCNQVIAKPLPHIRVSPTPSMLRYISTSLQTRLRPESCIRQSHLNSFLNLKKRSFANIMAHVNGDAPKITLYTNHGCPWAHRAHIVLKELGLKYDEVIIDLNTPREPWYLEINPVST